MSELYLPRFSPSEGVRMWTGRGFSRHMSQCVKSVNQRHDRGRKTLCCSLYPFALTDSHLLALLLSDDDDTTGEFSLYRIT